MHITRKVANILPALSLALGLCSYASADIDWSLNVKFSDGGIARGMFITNDAGTELESWKVHVKKGLEAHNFLSQSKDGVSTSKDFGELTTIENPISWPGGTVEALEFANFRKGEYAVFYLGDLLTGDPITILGALDCGKGSSCGVYKSGSITDPPLPLPSVPEPFPIILLGSGVVFVSLAMRRRGKKHRA